MSDERREDGFELRLTAGLKRPPLIRKKTQALTAKEKPKASEMYNNWDGFFCTVVVMTVVPVLVLDLMDVRDWRLLTQGIKRTRHWQFVCRQRQRR